MDFVAYLKEAGPFTTPLCVFMAIAGRVAFKYLTDQNTALRAELVTAKTTEIELREKIADRFERAAREYAEVGEATRNSLRELREFILSKLGIQT